MSKHTSLPDAKGVLALLAKLGRTEFNRSDIRFAATGHHKPKYLGGLGYVTPVLRELMDRGWIEHLARDRYCVTERGWQATSS
jgi:hypothetical protein